jgi:hypothetical protein
LWHFFFLWSLIARKEALLKLVAEKQNFDVLDRSVKDSHRDHIPSFSLAFLSSAGSRGFSGSFSSTGVSSSLTAAFDFLFSALGFGSFFSFFFSVAAGSFGEVSFSFVVLAGCHACQSQPVVKQSNDLPSAHHLIQQPSSASWTS